GLHVNFSLLPIDGGANSFDDPHAEHGISTLARQCMGGLIAHHEALAAPSALPAAEGSSAVENAERKPSDPKDKKGAKGMKDDKDKAVPEGWHREGFALKKGKDKVELVGYLQEDFRRYDWTVKDDPTGSKVSPKHELRRLRVGAKARFGALSLEFGADPRSSQAPSRLKDATIGYEFSKKFSLLVGHFKPSVSQEFLTSAGKTDFVDRSLIGSRLSPDRDWGVAVSGEIGKVEYTLGGFGGDGDASFRSASNSGAARFVIHLVKGFQVAGSFMQGKVTPDPRVGSTEPSAKGASGQTATGFTFWGHPHVSGTRRREGADLSYSRGPFRFQAEYLENREQRLGQGSTGQDIPDMRGRGFSAQASYVLTGEKKGSTVEPKKSIFQGGPGAVEVVARAETLKFDDTGDGSGFAGYGNRARNVAPTQATALQAGVNYFASNFLKFQGSALWESYNDPLIAPVPGKTGHYLTLLARVQVTLP
ncbi:MAG: porin, partial [Vicinamibacteria bacterium]